MDAAVLAWLADEALSPDVIHDACERARARSRAVEPDPRVAPLVAEEADLARVVARLTAAIEHGADDVGGVVARLRERSARLAARRAREVLSVGYAERPDLVRAVLGAVLVGRVRVGLRDGRLWLEGEAAPSRLSPDEPGGTRGAETTPTGPARSPGSVDVRVPLRRAV